MKIFFIFEMIGLVIASIFLLIGLGLGVWFLIGEIKDKIKK